MNTQFDNTSVHALASAMHPGVVIGEPDDGLVNFVTNLDQIARGETAGYNSRIIGGYRQLFPRLSKLDYEKVALTGLEEAEGVLETVIESVPYLTAQDRAAYLAARKVVKQLMPDGATRLIVVPRLPSAMSEMEIRQHEYGQEEEALPGMVSEEELAARAKKRTYTLAQILTDHDVLPKYDLSLRAVETAKRVAATDPGAAAGLFQSMMNSSQQDVAVSVTAGEYSRNRVQAKNAIRQLCRHAPRVDAAVSSIVSFDKFTMLGPGGEDGWCVTGPLKHATEISYVYWMVNSEGCINPSVLLAMELVLLGIDIYDGFTAQEPEITYHATLPGSESLPLGIPSETASLLSTTGRVSVEALADRMMPVLGSDGRQLATAVRVTGKYILVNSHVVDSDRSCTVGGELVAVKSQLSRDLWCAKSEGDSDPWVLREPVLGELVVICYLQNGQMGCSAPLKIASIDASCIVTTLDASISFGASGGALVALSDLALLGVHSAATNTNLLSYRFGENQFAELLESDSVTSFSRHSDVGSFAARTMDHFKKRGLSQVLSTAIAVMEPVYVDNRHVGMAVSSGDHVYTTCDAEQPLRIGVERRVAKFETVLPGYYKAEASGRHVSPIYRRAPNYFEKVFILGHDSEPFISSETTVMHVGPNNRSFVIGDLPALDKPITGGLVMGWDGAVLGVCGSRSMTTVVGLGYTCWPLVREEVPIPTEPRSVLAAAFPFLSLSAWPDALIEEIFTHPSVGRYSSGRLFNAGPKPLANVGDNVAKSEMYKVLRECGVPHSTWSNLIQQYQDNIPMAKAAWKCNIAQALILGVGVTLNKDAKAYADIIEATVGAAALMEKPDTVALLCRSMGLIYTPPRPAVTRSVSQFE